MEAGGRDWPARSTGSSTTPAHRRSSFRQCRIPREKEGFKFHRRDYFEPSTGPRKDFWDAEGPWPPSIEKAWKILVLTKGTSKTKCRSSHFRANRKVQVGVTYSITSFIREREAAKIQFFQNRSIGALGVKISFPDRRGQGLFYLYSCRG